MPAPESYRWPRFKWPSELLSPLICAAIALGVGPSSGRAQGGIPLVQGSYQGTVDFSVTCNLPIPLPFPLPQGQLQVSANITSQTNGAFSGTLGPISLSGTVDASGRLQGTYDDGLPQSVPGLTITQTFTGQVDTTAVPKTIAMNLTDTITSTDPDQTVSCTATYNFQGTALTAGGASADLSITGSAFPTPVAAGNRITYSLTVTNAGPDDATNTMAVNRAPAGTAIVAAASSQGQCVTTPGSAICSLGTIAHGGTATITVTANLVSAEPGATLVDSPNVSSSLFDSNFANNSTTISTPIVGGAIIKLVWDQPPPTASNPTPAPHNLRVELAGPPSSTTTANSERAACYGCASQRIAPQDTCTIIRVNIYISDSAPVQPIPVNLFVAVAPADSAAAVDSRPGGSFYVITNVWQCGDTIIESGVSNQASVPAGPTVTNLKVAGKLKGLGSGFVDGVQVFVNGVGFVKQAVTADSTLVIQKGALTDGTAITDLGTAGSVLVTFKNPDGGLGSFTFKRP
jgi:uncharacterized repeat protein (TIGR01451 family)